MSTVATPEELLEQWKTAGLEEITVSSGLRFRVRPVTPAQLITSGMLPYELIGALVQAEENGEQPSADVVGKATLEYLGKERELAARAVHDVWNGETWAPIEIPPEAFADGRTFPPADVEAITELAMKLLRSAAESEGVSTSDMATFRGNAPGPDDRPDGGAVRAAPIAPRRDRRTAARAAGRRGDRPSPGPG